MYIIKETASHVSALRCIGAVPCTVTPAWEIKTAGHGQFFDLVAQIIQSDGSTLLRLCYEEAEFTACMTLAGVTINWWYANHHLVLREYADAASLF